jgi:3-oxoacyl-[acyl-carrier-protein] synthase-3
MMATHSVFKKALVIGVEKITYLTDWQDRNTCVLFGDGAGAVVLSRSENEKRGIMSTHLHSQGKYADILTVKSPSIRHWVPAILANKEEDLSYFPYMDGQTVFKHAIVRFSEAINEGLEANGLSKEDIDMFIPHQANLRISQFVQKRFGLSDDQVFNNIMKYGNTTAASIAIAMTEAWELGKIKEGDLVVLAAFGSGFTWGSVVIRW